MNLAKGAASAIYQAVMLIVIPLFTFDYIKNVQVAGINIGMTPEKYETISFFIVNIGLVVVALSFFSASSPKRTVRKGIVNLLKIFFNAIYIWSYKFSGATVFVLEFVTVGELTGSVTLDFTYMASMVIGVVFLNIILAIIDIIDWGFFPDEEKVKEAEEYRKKVIKSDGTKKPLNLPPLKKDTGVKMAEDIKLSSKPELAKLKPVDDDFLSKPIEEFKKSKSDDENEEQDLNNLEAD